MATIRHLKKALEVFNVKYPRPEMEVLKVSRAYNIKKDYHKPYPNCDKPGVYIICHTDGTILRVGKASCSRTITVRLGEYFKWSKDGAEGIHKHAGYEDAKLIYTIGVPNDRAFEVPAIEEYLIRELELPYNRIGRKKL